MFNYSPEGLAVRPAFFGPRRDITIIVEDRGKENFYAEVLHRLLEDRKKTAKVLGLGGKSQVLKRLTERNKTNNDWKEFYLVDGDFDEILGIEFSDSIYSYRLRKYDIESYLVEEFAVCTLAVEEAPQVTIAQYQQMLNLKDWVSDVVDATIRLVACAAVLRELDQCNLRMSTNIERFFSDSNALPDVSLIENEISRLKEAVLVIEPAEFDIRLQTMLERMGNTLEDRLRWISGKDIFIPLIIKLLRQQMRRGRNLSKESVCFRLAKNCTFEELNELRDRILAVA